MCSGTKVRQPFNVFVNPTPVSMIGAQIIGVLAKTL